MAFACAAASSYSASAFAFAFGCDGTFTFALPVAVVLLLFHLLLHLGFLLGAPCQFPVVSSEAVSVLGAAAAVFDYASVLAAVFASACDALAFAVGAAFA